MAAGAAVVLAVCVGAAIQAQRSQAAPDLRPKAPVARPADAEPNKVMVTVEQRHEWALATGAILTRSNQQSFVLLGGIDPVNVNLVNAERDSVKEWWGIDSRESARNLLKWLRDVGHRADYDQMAAFVARDPRAAASARSGDPLRFVIDHRVEIGPKSLLAWDLCRLVNVAGWCYVLGYISEDDAWDWVMPAARRLQATYTSWEDLGKGYCLGRHFWNPQIASSNAAEEAVHWLTTDRTSPWRRLDWQRDLGK